MMNSLWPVVGVSLIVLLALSYGFSNGFRNSSTIVATVVSTRALSPRLAFTLCAVFEFLGALLIGSAVVTTVGRKLFQQPLNVSQMDLMVVLCAALMAALGWGMIGWWRAWPISNNQALIAGLAGAAVAAWGFEILNQTTLLVVFCILVISPLVGFFASIFVTGLIRYLGSWLTPAVSPVVKRLHVLSCLVVSSAHGSNDAQMIMGLLLMAFGILHALGIEVFAGQADVSFWVRVMVAFSLALGMRLGGKRILKRLGMKFYHIKPTQGLGAQLTSAMTILSCNVTGFPASTTQVITGSIVGAGVAKNPKAIRWSVAQDIVYSWLFTVPAVGIFGYLLTNLILMRMG